VSILFYFVVVTDLNPYSRDIQQDTYDKSVTLKPEETTITRQWQPKHISAAMNQHTIQELLESQHATREELWETVFSMRIKILVKDLKET
jgi:hypothetical protein